ncbi:hypothetical protein ACFV3R_08970 [Streptomyces sp. NPDC059740]|uniref:hypothetical protein n=1 Tax=Streptomyces sp. NPDC059740 TaxID=3346926 RepID=UPI0036699E4A
MAISTDTGATQVTVQLSDCGESDADAVFTALGSAFASDRAPDQHPHTTPGTHPTVWSSVFDVSQTVGDPAPAELQGAVNAEVQGGIQAVHLLEDALRRAFTVEEEGVVAGDQEREVQLSLRSR